jgi:hypothetical protein
MKPVGAHPLVMNKLDYVGPLFTDVTTGISASHCNNIIGGFSIMELASFNMVAHQIPDHIDVIDTMYQYLSTDHEFWLQPDKNEVASVLLVQDAQNRTAISIQGVTNER